MAESLIVKNKRDGTLTLFDFGSVNSLIIPFRVGDLSIAVPTPTINNYLDRGRITSPPSIRYVDDQPISGSFTAYLRDLEDAAYACLFDLLTTRGGGASSWVSRMGSTGEVFAVMARWDIAGTVHGDPSNHRIELDYVCMNGTVSEGDPSQIAVNFTSFALNPTTVT